jgi:hypothetical protein
LEKGEKVFSARSNLLFIVTLLSVAIAANAAPTVAIDGTTTPAVQAALDTPAAIVPTNETVGPIDTKFANLGREFLQPPNFTGMGDTQSNYVKPLPAVPAAIFMVLSGFLCVSLVRDRRAWLAALTGLLWVGQTGVQVLPQLALRLSSKNHSQQQFSADLAYSHYLENSHRLRSDIEGTQYIGLLRYLEGIPATLRNSNKKTPNAELRTQNKVPQFAAYGVYPYLISANICLARRAEQSVYFNPAFIFAQLPRGPPIQA